MIEHPVPRPHWSTSSIGADDGGPLLDLDALREHLRRCRGAGGRLFALRCAAEAIGGFVGSRLFSALALLLIVLAGVSWLAGAV